MVSPGVVLTVAAGCESVSSTEQLCYGYSLPWLYLFCNVESTCVLTCCLMLLCRLTWKPVWSWQLMQVRALNFTAKTLFSAMMEEVQKEEPATIRALLYHDIHSDHDTSFRCVTCIAHHHYHHHHHHHRCFQHRPLLLFSCI